MHCHGVFFLPLLQVQYVNTVPPAQGARTLLAATDLSQLVAPRNWSCTVSALVDGADVTAVSPCRLANASFGAADTPWALSSCPRHHSPRRDPAPAPTTSPASHWSAMTTAGAHVHDHSASIVSTSDVASGVASPHGCNKLHAGSCTRHAKSRSACSVHTVLGTVYTSPNRGIRTELFGLGRFLEPDVHIPRPEPQLYHGHPRNCVI